MLKERRVRLSLLQPARNFSDGSGDTTMDEYQRLLFLDSRRKEIAREIQAERRGGGEPALPNVLRGLVALGVLLLGMLAWWGH
jgi:hypothetical protein